MITQLIAFLVVVSALSTAAAWCAEGGLRRLGVPTRWIWLGALAAPWVMLGAPLLRTPSATAGALPGIPVVELAPLVVGPAPDRVLGLEVGVAVAWGLVSVLFAILLVRTHRALAGERTRWLDSEVSGRRVYVSPDRGPAVAGVFRPWIVLPRWSLGLPAEELDLIVLHEEEHLRARDSILLTTALALVAANPWNPLTWLQLRLLRTAMEVDCDRRVLRRVPDRARYGASLLSVAARSSGLSLGLAAFTERSLSLKTRILAMTPRNSRWTPVRAAGLLLLGSLLAVQACSVDIVDDEQDAAALATGGEQTAAGLPTVDIPAPPPTSISESSNSEEQTSEVAVGKYDGGLGVVRESDRQSELNATEADLRTEPTFTPFTVAPAILNRNEVVDAMQENYPPLLKDAGIGGTVAVYFFINQLGVVEDVRINNSSGHRALDDAALAVADVYRFAPAYNGDDPVSVWVSFPITFQVMK